MPRTAVRPLGSAPVVLGCALAVAALSLAVGSLVQAVGELQVPLTAVAVTGGLLGVMAAPPVRLPLERRDAQGRGKLVVLTGALLAVALVTSTGLGVLTTVVAVGTAAHAVQVRPTRQQVLFSCAVVVGLTAASLAAQLAGWVPSLVAPRQALPVMVAALLLMGPQVLNVASISRRAQEAGRALEVAQRRHVEELERAALCDALTGLLSRRGLAGPLARAAATAGPRTPRGVLFIDLDGFKAVNDTHGHAAGDELLREVARRLDDALGHVGAVARTGGDEFVVVLGALERPDEAEAAAVAVHAALTAPVRLPDGADVVVGASVGVAVAQAPSTCDELLARADAAMYLAKRRRRAGRADTAPPLPDPLSAGRRASRP